MARGDYVTFLGDDDGLAPGYFREVSKVVEEFGSPDVLYSALFQFMHPDVAPWDRGGYVADVKNAFFFMGKNTPFRLSKEEVQKAVQGSLDFRRNFTFNIQAFVFSKTFLSKLREDGPVFRSPFPDYYLANVVMAKAVSLVAIPSPLSIAGVSKASFGYTLFNDEEAKGAEMLNTELALDPVYKDIEKFLLPGPLYNTNYVVTMENVVRYLCDSDFQHVDFKRYRRLQIFSVLNASIEAKGTTSRKIKQLWLRLGKMEKLLTAITYSLIRCSNALGIYKKVLYPRLWKLVNPTEFPPITNMCDRGSYSRLTQVYSAIENGVIYNESAQG